VRASALEQEERRENPRADSLLSSEPDAPGSIPGHREIMT